MEERIVELELRFTEQAALLEDLSGVVHEQEKQLAILRGEVARLQGRLEQAEERLPPPAGERPPHY